MTSEIQITPSLNPVTAPLNSEPATPNSEATHTQADAQEVKKTEAPSIAELSEQNVEEIKETVAAINEFMAQFQRTLNFSVDQDAGQTVIKVIDKSNDELIRQIPSASFLELSKHIEHMNNLLFSEKV